MSARNLRNWCLSKDVAAHAETAHAPPPRCILSALRRDRRSSCTLLGAVAQVTTLQLHEVQARPSRALSRGLFAQ